MHNSAQRKFKFALKLLNMLGYVESPLPSKICGIIFLSINFIFLLGEVVGLVNRTTISAQIEILYSCMISFLHLLSYYCIKSHQKQLKQFL